MSLQGSLFLTSSPFSFPSDPRSHVSARANKMRSARSLLAKPSLHLHARAARGARLRGREDIALMNLSRVLYYHHHYHYHRHRRHTTIRYVSNRRGQREGGKGTKRPDDLGVTGPVPREEKAGAIGSSKINRRSRVHERRVASDLILLHRHHVLLLVVDN